MSTCFPAQQFCVKEAATAIYAATITDQDGAPLGGLDLFALTLTLYDQKTQAIINDRDEQDVLNVNGVTIDSGGLLTWEITPADNAFVGTKADEIHVALFRYYWNGGDRAHWHEVWLKVQNQAVIV